MTHEELMLAFKVAAGLASAVLGGVGIALGFLFRLAWKLGGDAKEIRDGLDTLRDIKKAVDDIPLLKQRMGTVEEAWRTTRSDIKHLLRGSHPGFNGTGREEDD